MSTHRFPVYEPLSADNIETARLCALSSEHAHKPREWLDKKKREFVKLKALVEEMGMCSPILRADQAVLERDIATLEAIIRGADA